MNLRKNEFDQVQSKIDNIVYLTDDRISREIINKHEKLDAGYELDCQHKLIEKNIAEILAVIKVKEKDYLKLVTYL